MRLSRGSLRLSSHYLERLSSLVSRDSLITSRESTLVSDEYATILRGSLSERESLERVSSSQRYCCDTATYVTRMQSLRDERLSSVVSRESLITIITMTRETNSLLVMMVTARPYESCKIFKGRPCRNAFSKLVHRQYKSFPPDRFCQVEMKNPTTLSNKTSNA